MIKEPNKLLQMILPQLKSGSEFLDLGCGTGIDAIFMVENDFIVTAVDNSQEKISMLKEAINNKGDLKNNIRLFRQDINIFAIEKNKYQVIQAFNSLQFLTKETGLKIIENIRESLSANGFIIISCFTIGDSLYQKPINKNRCFFEPQELKNLFSDSEIIFYKEKIIGDPGHPNFEQPHQHAVARLVAKKNN